MEGAYLPGRCSMMSLPVYECLYGVPRFGVTVIWISRESPPPTFSSSCARLPVSTFTFYGLFVRSLARWRVQGLDAYGRSRISRIVFHGDRSPTERVLPFSMLRENKEKNSRTSSIVWRERSPFFTEVATISSTGPF